MTKRKASIFTVAEAVPNWFAVDGYTVAPLAQEEGPINNQSETNSKGRNPVAPDQSTKAQAITGWATAYPHTWLTGVDATETDIWSEGVQVYLRSADLAEATSRGASGETKDPVMAKPAEDEAMGQQAFWALVRAAGYETW